MVGLKLNISKNNTFIDTSKSVQDFDAAIQNAMVNIATRGGSDGIYPDKGTDLLVNALAGKVVGFNDANHESQVAAINTLFFSRNFDVNEPDTKRIGKISMTPVTYTDNVLTINAAFTDLAESRTVGVTTNI